MLDTVYAAMDRYEQQLADAERTRRFLRQGVYEVRFAAPLRRLFIMSGNFLIALGTRLKSIPPAVRQDAAEATS